MIKVASYNMRKGIGTDRRRRPERILDVLREIDADIVCLQEADRRFGARAQVIGHDLLDKTPWRAVSFGGREASMGWHGNAILVRRAAESVDREPIFLPALEPRGAVMADVQLGGEAIRVVGMHLDLSGLWRRRQAHAILTHLAQYDEAAPHVLMGDLNEWSAHGGCLRDFAQHHRIAPVGRSFHARRPIATLDRIMVTPDLAIIDCGTHRSPLARRASDHLPVWADLAPGGAPKGITAPRATWPTRVRASLMRPERRRS